MFLNLKFSMAWHCFTRIIFSSWDIIGLLSCLATDLILQIPPQVTWHWGSNEKGEADDPHAPRQPGHAREGHRGSGHTRWPGEFLSQAVTPNEACPLSCPSIHVQRCVLSPPLRTATRSALWPTRHSGSSPQWTPTELPYWMQWVCRQRAGFAMIDWYYDV